MQACRKIAADETHTARENITSWALFLRAVWLPGGKAGAIAQRGGSGWS
jgi:hypothetical protein